LAVDVQHLRESAQGIVVRVIPNVNALSLPLNRAARRTKRARHGHQHEREPGREPIRHTSQRWARGRRRLGAAVGWQMTNSVYGGSSDAPRDCSSRASDRD